MKKRPLAALWLVFFMFWEVFGVVVVGCFLGPTNVDDKSGKSPRGARVRPSGCPSTAIGVPGFRSCPGPLCSFISLGTYLKTRTLVVTHVTVATTLGCESSGRKPRIQNLKWNEQKTL